MQLCSEKAQKASDAALSLGGTQMCPGGMRGSGLVLWAALSRRPPCTRAGRRCGRSHELFLSLQPSAELKKGFSTEEVGAEGCPVFMRPFSLHCAVVTTPGHPTHMCS